MMPKDKKTFDRGSLKINPGPNRTPVVCDLLEEIFKDPGKPLNEHARKHGITAGRVYHLMKEKTGVVKVGKWRHFQRMQYAADLLFHEGLSPKIVADYCGYADIQSFSRAFKDFWGKAPRPWQKWAREVKDKHIVFEIPEGRATPRLSGPEGSSFIINKLEYIPPGWGSP